MADLYNYITETGVITPDATEIQTTVENEYKAAFGQDLVVAPDTPQGALIVAEVLARKSVADNNVALANQFNPNLAGGIFLDAIGALTGATRKVAAPTIIGNVTLTGVAGTVLNAGTTIAQTTSGDQYALRTTVTLPAMGDFEALDLASLPPAPGTLTQIGVVLPGWETVNNTGTTIAGVTLTGTAGTIVPAGQKAQIVPNGQVFVTTQQVTLPATVTMIAENYGAFTVAPNTLTQLINPVPGLTGINNGSNAIVTPGTAIISPGTPVQSDASFRDYRRLVLGIQGSNLAQSVIAAVASVEDVSDVLMRENPTNVQDANGLSPHSIYLCVDGGTDTDVATAINYKKGGGCGYNHLAGGVPVDVPVTNAYSQQVVTVSFDRPAYVLLSVNITVKANVAVADPITAVTNALNNYVLKIGQPVNVYELAGAITSAVPGLYIVSITTSNGGAFGTAEIPIAIYQRAQFNIVQVTIV